MLRRARCVCAREAEPSGYRVHPGTEAAGRHAQVLLNQLLISFERDDRQPVEQVLQFVCDGLRQQVFAQTEDLSQLDVGGSHHFQPAPELNGEGQADDFFVEEGPSQREEEAQDEHGQIGGGALRLALAYIGKAAAEDQPRDIAHGHVETTQQAVGRAFFKKFKFAVGTVVFGDRLTHGAIALRSEFRCRTHMST